MVIFSTTFSSLSFSQAHSRALKNLTRNSVTIQIYYIFSGKTSAESSVVDVGCGSRHTVCLTQGNNLWSFGWNKYGQLGVGDTKSRDSVAKMVVPPRVKQKEIAMLRCGDWGTAVVTSNK